MLNQWIPHNPFIRQAIFLTLDDKEALYGGAAGGGKSDALLMAALMYVDEPGYNAILFRQTYKDLALPEAIMARSHEWLSDTAAEWNGTDYRWTFPSGATLSFGYLSQDKHKFRYQSAAFQFIGFDELTQFPSNHYLYLFSRLRRLADVNVPLRMRGGTNPGGIGNDWVFERFVVDKSRPFIPALLSDNPFIDQAEYRRSLSELDETTRKQLEEGLWVTNPEGKPFQRGWWRAQNRYWVDDDRDVPTPIGRWISWDTALEDKETSAFSAAVVGEILADYTLRIVDVWQDKILFPELPDAITRLSDKWNHDGKLRGVLIEGAASGKPAIQTLRMTNPDIGRLLVEIPARESKEERGQRAAVWCRRGMVHLPYPNMDVAWLDGFERQLFNFPDTQYKDQVDAFAQLVLYLENFLATSWHGKRARKEGADDRVSRALKSRGA